MKPVNRNAKSKMASELELDAFTPIDILENKILSLMTRAHQLEMDNAQMRARIESGHGGLYDDIAEKKREIEEKDQIIRRQQAILKSKEAAYQALQHEYHLQRQEFETLLKDYEKNKNASRTEELAGRAPSYDQAYRENVKNKVKTVLQKLEKLEKMMISV